MFLLFAALGCSPAPPKTPAGGSAGTRTGTAPIDPAEPERPEPAPSWPAGLVPCPKDAPPGEGCAAPSGQRHNAPAHPGEADSTVWKVPVGTDDPIRGAPNGLVTVVVFSDFECPFCKREASVMKELIADYPSDVRVVWKDCPLPAHPEAEPAAELARAARASLGDAGFWKVHDSLYESQNELGDALFRTIAKSVGLEWERVSTDLKRARYGEKIRASLALSDRVDVPATPTVFVNGRKLVGAQPYEKLRALVNEELEKAKARRGAAAASGSALYDALISGGKELEPPTDLPPH